MFHNRGGNFLCCERDHGEGSSSSFRPFSCNEELAGQLDLLDLETNAKRDADMHRIHHSDQSPNHGKSYCYKENDEGEKLAKEDTQPLQDNPNGLENRDTRIHEHQPGLNLDSFPIASLTLVKSPFGYHWLPGFFLPTGIQHVFSSSVPAPAPAPAEDPKPRPSGGDGGSNGGGGSGGPRPPPGGVGGSDGGGEGGGGDGGKPKPRNDDWPIHRPWYEG